MLGTYTGFLKGDSTAERFLKRDLNSSMESLKAGV